MKWPTLKHWDAFHSVLTVYLLGQIVGQTVQELWDHGVRWPSVLGFAPAVAWLVRSIARRIARLMGTQ